MPTFQFLLHTSDICLVMDDDVNPCVGFYTSRRAKAPTSEEAFKMAMQAFDTDPEMLEIFQTALDQGLRPKTEIEEVYLIPWWKAWLPWKIPALNFYQDAEEID